MTINRSWGYNSRDTAYKSAEQIIHALLGAAGRGANLLLNVGPQPDGTIGPEVTQRLQEVGKWLEVHGESVYGTRRGPIPPQPWGVSTARGSTEHPDKIYLHVLNQKDATSIVFDPSFAWTPYLFGKSTPLALKQAKGSLVLELPTEIRLPIDTIVTLSPKASGR
jgi:alpha-L-fucosidase